MCILDTFNGHMNFDFVLLGVHILEKSFDKLSKKTLFLLRII